ncbi:MAG: DMT family transporter [Caulobacteraceae bacterium]|nr:DMT family transporter [Caulobacteraceae bacterium]
MVWAPVTVVATLFQVARNALQRGLLTDAGPWGATLVRFLFGLPFAALFAAAAWLASGRVAPHVGARFWIACAAGGGAQMGATAAMLVSMRRSSFALGTLFQQSSIPFAALIGLSLGDRLSAAAWVGLLLASSGLVMLGWPSQRLETRDWSAGGLGLLAGAGFAVSANAVRQATHALEPRHIVFAAMATVLAVQALQSLALTAWLAVADRAALRAVAARWRSSLPAGLFGAAASGLWFTAFAMAPAGPVRAVGAVEAPVAAIAGRRLFAERLTFTQLLLGAQVALGIALAALR